MKKRWIYFLLIFIFSIFLISCKDTKIEDDNPIDPIISDDDNKDEKEEIKEFFKDKEIIIYDNKEVEIELLGDLKYSDLEYFIEDDRVLDIKDGKIIPKETGSCKIWGEYNYIACEIDVIVMPVVECDLCSEDEVIYVGARTNIIIANYSGDFNDFEILSTNSNVEIKGNEVRFLKPGDVDIVIAKKDDRRLNDRLSFRVKATKPVLTCDSNEIDVDEYVKIDVENYKSCDLFNFYVSDPSVLELDDDYYGLALKPGKVLITARLKEDEEVSSTIEIVVRNVPIKTAISNQRILIGDEFNIDIYNYENEDVFDFEFSDDSIITKTKEKAYKAVNEGTTLLTISLKEDKNTKIEIELIVYPINPVISVGSNVLQIGQTGKISILNYLNIDDFDIEFSNDELIELNGAIITCKEKGNLVITVTKKDNRNIKSSISVEIIPIQPKIYLSSDYINVGGTSGLFIKNIDELNEVDLSDFNIDISPLGIIEINGNTISGLKEGEAKISLVSKTDNLVKGDIDIIVTKTTKVLDNNNEPNEGVLLLSVYDNPTAYLYAGEFYQVLIDGASNRENYRWISTDAKVATVNDSGRVIAVGAGVSQVAAINKLNGEVKGTINITVYGVPNVDYAARLVKIATEELGYHEGPNNDTKYGAWYNLNYEAWCAMFVSWCCNQAGISTDVVPKYCGCTAGMNWFIERGRFEYRESGYIPKAGDIAFYRDRDVTSWTSTHTGIVYAATSSYVYTIEGNTSDMCAKRSYSINSTYILGYGVPDYPEFDGTPATFTPGSPENGERHNTR